MTRLTLILCLGEKQEELSCGKKENSFFYVCQLKLFSLFPDCQENKLENNKKKTILSQQRLGIRIITSDELDLTVLKSLHLKLKV